MEWLLYDVYVYHIVGWIRQSSVRRLFEHHQGATWGAEGEADATPLPDHIFSNMDNLPPSTNVTMKCLI